MQITKETVLTEILKGNNHYEKLEVTFTKDGSVRLKRRLDETLLRLERISKIERNGNRFLVVKETINDETKNTSSDVSREKSDT